MTPLQRLTLRGSEIRQRLAELGGTPELTDENRAELDGLRNEYQDVERRSQALTIADDAPEPIETRSEDREFRDLERRSNVGELLDSILAHRAADGAIAELQQHHGLDGESNPAGAACRGRTGNTGRHASTRRRGPKSAARNPVCVPAVGGRIPGRPQPTVPVGEAVYPVLTAALDVGTPAENAEQSETTGAFSADVLSPSRLQAAFFYSREDRARFAGMDAALRQNLSDGLADGLDAQVIAGVNGLLGSAGLTAPTAPTVTATFATYRGLVYDATVIDGRFASGGATCGCCWALRPTRTRRASTGRTPRTIRRSIR